MLVVLFFYFIKGMINKFGQNVEIKIKMYKGRQDVDYEIFIDYKFIVF